MAVPINFREPTRGATVLFQLFQIAYIMESVKRALHRNVGLFSLVLISGFFLCAPTAGAATIYSNSATGNDTTGDGTIGTPYLTFHKAYTIASANDTINLNGTFTWTDAGETGDAATTGYTLAKNLTITGQSSTSTILQAATASTTADRRVLTISAGAVVSMSKVNIRNGRLTSTSYEGGGISNSGTLTITDSEVNNNTAGGGGGGINNVATTTVQRVSVYNNKVSYMGGGILNNYYVPVGGYMVVENSTIYGNFQTSTSAYLNGGGVHVRGGSISLTNNTITGNIAKGGGGLGIDTTGTVYLKNNIIAGNISQNSSAYNDLSRSSGTIVDNGYNIIGQPGGYALAATGDWSDTNIDGTFNLYSVGTTGTLNLDTGASINDNATSTPTWALLAGSIAINTGSTGSNGATSTVPTLDQRGAGRNGATDIGSFEYDGTGLSITAPSTQATSVTFSNVQYNLMTIGWTAGNGSRRVVFMKAAASGTATPVDGTDYTVSTVFGSGTQIGSTGWYAVYEGLGTSVTVTGLTTGVTYSVQVFEYNGIALGAHTYNANTATGNPSTQQSHAITTLYANSVTGDDATGNGSSGSPYKTFHKIYTTSLAGDTLNLSGTFTWTDAAETGDAVTTGYTIGKELIIIGQSAASTIIQASSTEATADRRVFTISTANTVTFRDMTIRYGRITGGSDYGGGIYNKGTTTVERLNVSNNYSGGTGGGIAHGDPTNGGSLTVRDSLISFNTGVSQGGGLHAVIDSTGPMHVVNTTVVHNTQQASSATVGGGGVAYRGGSGTITNSTIAYNNLQNAGTATGAGVWFGSGSSATLQIKNSIVTSNYVQGVTLTDARHDITENSGTITDNGNNIFGRYTTSHFATTSTTWVDQQGSGTLDGSFTKTGSAGGTLSLGSALAINNTLQGTQTLAITLSGSIAVDNGSTDANGSISIPSTDQRGGTRSGSTDIGAFEYGAGGLTDTTAPTVSISAPAAAAYVAGASVSITATAGDETSLSGVKFYVDNTLQGSEDTSSPYSITWDSTATTTGAHTVFAVARDASANFATSSSVSFTVDNTVPTVSLTAPANAATVGGSAVTISASASDDTSLAGVKFYVNNVFQGSEDTSSPYSISWNSTATSSGAKTIVAVARDSANNYATSSSISITVDNTAPSVSTLVPADNATGIAATTTLSITFSENVTAVSGKNIVIKKSSDNSTVETIAANDTTKVAVSGTGVVVTLSTLGDLLGYYVQIDSGAFVDAASNAYAGISNTTSWNFTTRDINPPTVSSFSPADGASGVSPTANLVIVFSETVTAVAAKNIIIKKSSDDSTIETIVANNTGLVTVSGATVTINPAATLSSAVGYYVQVDSGAFKDAANLNYAGIANSTTWNFIIADASAPSVSLTLPTNGVIISGSAIGMSATASDDVAVAGVRFYVNNVAVGAEDTSPPYSAVWNSLATSSGQKVVFAVARDSSNNYATSTSATVTLVNTPTPTSLVMIPATTTATVSWTTPTEGSSRMYFGLVTAIGSSTPEANAGSGVTSHSVDLSGLSPCTVYRYVTVSKTEGGDVATSSQSTFTTAGCTGNASVVSNTEGTITTSSGGTLTEGKLTLAVPSAFTGAASSVTFQVNKLNGATFFSSVSSPSGKNAIGTGVYNLKAFTDETTTLSNFSEPLTVTLEYDDADVAGIDETTLKIQRYDSGWSELSSCSVDTSANTVSCTTTNFSDFAIFGDSSSSGSAYSGGGSLLWCSGPLAPGWNTSLPYGGCGGSILTLNQLQAMASTSLSARPTPKLVFTRSLRTGSQGTDVQKLQKLLNAKGFLVAKSGPGAPGKESMTFGPRTRAALIKFQEAHAREILWPINLKKGTGVCGLQTLKFINALST